MPATIKIKNSSTASAVPTSSDLVQGELAVNVTDKRLFTENSGGTVVELGTNPTILTMGAAGSASAPAITRTGDTNTGIFFPAADTIAFAEGGVEAMRLDSAGNMGLGVTPAAWGSDTRALQIFNRTSLSDLQSTTQLTNNGLWNGTSWLYRETAAAGNYNITGNVHTWRIAASGTAGNAITFTQAMTLDASGNLGVGVTSPSYKVDVQASSLLAAFYSTTYAAEFQIKSTATNVLTLAGGTGDAIAFATDGSERARIDSSGNLLVGTTSSSFAAGGIYALPAANGAGLPFLGIAFNSTAATACLSGYNTGGSAYRFYFKYDGGLANFSANNINLSDRREKTNFAPAGDYLAKICAIPVQTYHYIDQNLEEDDGLTLGVVAQDVQEVAPELVTESNWGTEEEPKMRLSIYQTDLQYALMKCIQEQQAIIETLTARITALEQA